MVLPPTLRDVYLVRVRACPCFGSGCRSDSHGVCIQDYPSQLSKPHKLLSGGPKGYKAVTWGVESDGRHYGPMRISAVSVRGHESHENCADF